MNEQQLKLVELDPAKQYVIMYHGRSPEPLKWEDKPANVSDWLLPADVFTIEELDGVIAELDKVRATLPPQEDTRTADGNDVS